MRRCLSSVVFGAFLLLLSDEAGAQQWFRLGRWEGETEVGVEYDRHDTKAGAGPSKFDRDRYDERVGIRNLGSYILDPRLFTSNTGVRFGLVQEEQRFDHHAESLPGTLIGYSFDSVVLPEKPYSLSLLSNRDESILSREFGGRTDLTSENHGAAFRLREDSVLNDLGFRYFSSMLGARREATKEDTTVLGQRFKRDETRTVLSYEGDKGFETSDLGLRYEFTDLVDRENPFATFQSQRVHLTYSRDWGPTLNRRWDSRLTYLDRSGKSASTQLSADEDLRIDHDANLFTDYRYLLSRSEIQSGATTTQTGIALLQHQLYRSLTTRLRADGTLEEVPDGERTRWGGQADFDYSRGLPGNGRAFAGVGGRYQVDDNSLKRSQIDVVDEPHTAPSTLGGNAGFTLANAFVISSTIVVTDTRGGARLPTLAGVDYIVVEEGNFTRIVPLAGSAVTLGGDPLAVSYTFDVNPSLRFSTAFWHGLAGVDVRWIALSFSHEQADQTLLSGRDSEFLEDRATDTARLDLRGDWEQLRGLASAQYQILDSTRLKYTRREFTESLFFKPFFDLVLGVTADESFTDFTVPKRTSDSYATRGTVDWTPRGNVLVSAFVGYRTLVDSQIPSETIREAGLRGRWTLGKLEVAPNFSWVDRQRGTASTTDMRIELRMIRRF